MAPDGTRSFANRRIRSQAVTVGVVLGSLAAGLASGAITRVVAPLTALAGRAAWWRTAAAAAAVATLLVARFPTPNRAIPLVALSAFMALGAAIDVAERKLPDRLTLGGGGVVVAVSVVACVLAGHPARVAGGLAGVILYAGPLLVVRLARPGDFGFGDVKFGLALGFDLGWFHPALAVVGLFVSFVAGLTMLAVSHRDRSSVPFGAAMAIGVSATLVVFGSLVPG
jgi:leader peptidase (prepilin peptidase) / N-methyltransferase